jgi:peptidyl-dipeptidase A
VKKHIALVLLVGSLGGGIAASCKKDNASTLPDNGTDQGSDTGTADQGSGGVSATDPLIAEAKQYVAQMNEELRKLYVDASQAQWTNETDITPEHEAAAAKAGAEQAKGITRLIKGAKKFEPILDKLDTDTRRQLLLLKFSGQPAPDDPAKADELAKIATEMSSLYGKGKVCEGGKPDGKKCKDLDALSKVLQSSRKPAELLAAWKGWHDNVGRVEKPLFEKYVGRSPVRSAKAALHAAALLHAREAEQEVR